MLGPGNDAAASKALAAWPQGLQLGGGITADNAQKWLDAGAEKVGILMSTFCVCVCVSAFCVCVCVCLHFVCVCVSAFCVCVCVVELFVLILGGFALMTVVHSLAC